MQAEEAVRKWRHRFFMVEKDVKRSEKLLLSFTGREAAKNKNRKGGEIDNYLAQQSSFQATGNLGLSGMARSLDTYDAENEISLPKNAASTPSAFMEALMFSDIQRREMTQSASTTTTSMSTTTLSNAEAANSRKCNRRNNNSRNKNTGGEGMKKSSIRGRMLPSPKVTAANSRKKLSKLETGTFADGMRISALDTYGDIVNNSNRRHTAQNRSFEKSPALWPPLEESLDDSLFY